jgi:hypothetical protein
MIGKWFAGYSAAGLLSSEISGVLERKEALERADASRWWGQVTDVLFLS